MPSSSRPGWVPGKVNGTHTLRKTFCRKVYLATGHDINLTRAVMGHASVFTTQQYLYVADEEVQAAVRAIGVKQNDKHVGLATAVTSAAG
jgi:integrase